MPEKSLQLAWLGLLPEHAQARGDLAAYEGINFLFVEATATDWEANAFERQAERIAALSYLLPSLHTVVRTAPGCGEVAAAQLAEALEQVKEPELPLGVVRNVSLLEQLDDVISAGCELRERTSQDPLAENVAHVTAAEAPLGPHPLVDAWEGKARVIVAENVGAATLVVAAAMAASAGDALRAPLIAQLAAAGQLIYGALPITRRRATLTLNADGVTLELPPGKSLRGEDWRAALADEWEGCPLAPFTASAEPPSGHRLALASAIQPAENPSSWPAVLLLDEGLSFTLAVQVDKPQADRRLQRFLQSLADSPSFPCDLTWRLEGELDGEGDEREAMLIITAMADEEAPLIELAAALEHAVMATPGAALASAPENGVGMLQHEWITSLPRAFVEPVVDVRPASEWAE